MNYDSQEELYFSWYLDELKEVGYIENYEAQPESYVLSEPAFYEYDKRLKTKTKTVVKKLIREHIYTADFRIAWAEKARGLFFNKLIDRVDLSKIPFVSNYYFTSTIEIKPTFDQNNMTRLFTINQKWMYQKQGVYVQKIVPVKLFSETFTPKRYLLTNKSLKPRKLKYTPETLEQFICQKTQN